MSRSASRVGNGATSATFLLTPLFAKWKPPARYPSLMKPATALIAAVLLVSACREEAVSDAPAADAGTHRREVEQWQTKRAERLRAEDGWLSLIGLFWLNEGENMVSVSSKAVQQPLRLTRSGGTVTLQSTPEMTVDGKPLAAPVALKNDTEEGGPTVIQIGTVRFQVIKRGERYGLRVKDAN